MHATDYNKGNFCYCDQSPHNVSRILNTSIWATYWAKDCCTVQQSDSQRQVKSIQKDSTHNRGIHTDRAPNNSSTIAL